MAPKYWSSSSWPFGGFAPNSVRPALIRIGTRQVEVLIDQKVFLLGAAGRDHALGGRAEQLEDPDGLLRERFHRAQERRLLVERLARPADERRRDDERHRAAAVEQPGRAGRIPRRVAARFEGRPHAARGETRRVGLALMSSLPLNSATAVPLPLSVKKRIVLFGGDAGQRLEPVRVVRRAVFDRPFLHRLCHRVGTRRVKRIAVGDRPPQGVIDRLGEPRLLHTVVEDEAAKRVARAHRTRLFGFCH